MGYPLFTSFWLLRSWYFLVYKDFFLKLISSYSPLSVKKTNQNILKATVSQTCPPTLPRDLFQLWWTWNCASCLIISNLLLCVGGLVWSNIDLYQWLQHCGSCSLWQTFIYKNIYIAIHNSNILVMK